MSGGQSRLGVGSGQRPLDLSQLQGHRGCPSILRMMLKTCSHPLTLLLHFLLLGGDPPRHPPSLLISATPFLTSSNPVKVQGRQDLMYLLFLHYLLD